jgi:hypothetical protein
MITKFDIFMISFNYEDGTGEKIRPVVIFDEGETEKTLEIVGVYSYRKWFKQDDRFYKIVEWKQAGLEKESYVKISAIESGDRSKFEDSEKIGHLTNRDINGLLSAIQQYYS